MAKPAPGLQRHQYVQSLRKLLTMYLLGGKKHEWVNIQWNTIIYKHIALANRPKECNNGFEILPTKIYKKISHKSIKLNDLKKSLQEVLWFRAGREEELTCHVTWGSKNSKYFFKQNWWQISTIQWSQGCKNVEMEEKWSV